MAKHGWKGFGIHPHIAENQPHEVRTLGMNHPVRAGKRQRRPLIMVRSRADCRRTRVIHPSKEERERATDSRPNRELVKRMGMKDEEGRNKERGGVFNKMQEKLCVYYLEFFIRCFPLYLFGTARLEAISLSSLPSLGHCRPLSVTAYFC